MSRAAVRIPALMHLLHIAALALIQHCAGPTATGELAGCHGGPILCRGNNTGRNSPCARRCRLLYKADATPKCELIEGGRRRCCCYRRNDEDGSGPADINSAANKRQSKKTERAASSAEETQRILDMIFGEEEAASGSVEGQGQPAATAVDKAAVELAETGADEGPITDLGDGFRRQCFAPAHCASDAECRRACESGADRLRLAYAASLCAPDTAAHCCCGSGGGGKTCYAPTDCGDERCCRRLCESKGGGNAAGATHDRPQPCCCMYMNRLAGGR